MRTILCVLAFIGILASTGAQTTRDIDPFVGRTSTGENLRKTTFPLLREADKLFRMFKFEESFLVLENAVAQNPYSAEALILRARLKRILGMNTEAKQDLTLAHRINPFAAYLYGYYGNAGLLKILAHYPEQALDKLSSNQKLNYYYEAMDEKIGGDELDAQEIILIERIIEDIENEQYAKASESVEKLLAEYPDAAVGYDLKGLLLIRQKRWSGATTALRKALELEPGFAIAWYNLGQIEKYLGNYQKAKTHFDKAIELQPELTKAYFDRALLLKKMGDKDAAIEDYNKIIEMKGSVYMAAYLNRGLTKKMAGDLQGALMDLNEVIETAPENPQLYQNRGNLQFLFGRPLKAIEDYSRAIQLDKQYAEAYYNRALAHMVVYDPISGCYDMERSADLGYEIAQERLKYFCSGIINNK